MLRMHNDGLITLPPPRNRRPDARVRLSALSDPQPRLEQPAAALKPLTWSRVQHKAQSRLWNELIERYHYLGHTLLPGRSCAIWSTPPSSPSPRSASVPQR